MIPKNKQKFIKATGDELEKAFKKEFDECLSDLKKLPPDSQKMGEDLLTNSTINLMCKNFFYAGANHGAETAAAMVKDFMSKNNIKI